MKFSKCSEQRKTNKRKWNTNLKNKNKNILLMTENFWGQHQKTNMNKINAYFDYFLVIFHLYHTQNSEDTFISTGKVLEHVTGRCLLNFQVCPFTQTV